MEAGVKVLYSTPGSTLGKHFPPPKSPSCTCFGSVDFVIAEPFALSLNLYLGVLSSENIVTENFSNLLLENILKTRFDRIVK